MTKTETALDLVKGLRQRKVGTNKVENAAKVQMEDVNRNEGVVIKHMDFVVKACEKK